MVQHLCEGLQQKECKLDSCLVKGTQKQVRPLQETNYPVLAYQDASMKSILLDLQSHKPIYWTTQTPLNVDLTCLF